MITDAIRDITTLYAEDIYDQNFLKNASPEQLQKVIVNIDPQLFLECLLLEIRGKTIAYCAWKKSVEMLAKPLTNVSLFIICIQILAIKI